MANPQKHQFRATIYKTGINFCVDVPAEITAALTATKSYIRIKGMINNFAFTKFLVPVKSGPYRLFVNMATLKGAKQRLAKRLILSLSRKQKTWKKNTRCPIG